jgi:predicted DNA-binding transcriptional regulator AlpA
MHREWFAPALFAGRVSLLAKERTPMTDLSIEALADAIADRLQKNPPVPRKWLSSQQAAAYLGLSEQTLALRVKQGNAPPSTLISRKARRFAIAKLDHWIEEGGALRG